MRHVFLAMRIIIGTVGLVLVLSSCTQSGSKAAASLPNPATRAPQPLLRTHTFLSGIEVDIHKTTGELLSTNSIGVTNGEVFLIPGDLADGKYHAMVSKPGSLVSRVDFEVLQGEVTKTTNLTLRFGDLDDNDRITPEELAFVTKKIGTDLNKKGAFFGDLSDKFRPGYADFNGDDKIDAADLALMAPYVGQNSDRLINN